MDFAEHLENTRRPDGRFDLAAAAQSRAAEILTDLETDRESLVRIAEQAANGERRAWEARNRDSLKKVFVQESLPGLDLESKVPLGDDIVVELGAMRAFQVQTRKDLRTQVHLAENEAYAIEMRFWYRIERILTAEGGTVAEAIWFARQDDELP